MLASKNVQEAMDFALSPRQRPLKRECLSSTFSTASGRPTRSRRSKSLRFDDMRAMIDNDLIIAHRKRGLTPDRPMHPRHLPEPRCLLSGQGDSEQILPGDSRPLCRRPWTSSPVSRAQYKLFDYFGPADAERVDRGHGIGRRNRPLHDGCPQCHGREG